MEIILESMRRGLKRYWKRRGYQRLNGWDKRIRNKVELGATGTTKKRRWRIKMVPKIRIPTISSSPKKLVLWVRDAYERIMFGLANSMGTSVTSYGGDITMGGFGRGPTLKEYDNKMIIHMYKSLIASQGQLVPRNPAPIMPSQAASQR